MNFIYKSKKALLAALKLVLLLSVTGQGAAAQQQAFSFTQYMDNLTPFNPAYAVLDKAGSINTLGRKQWVGVNGAPVSYLINANLPIETINGAVGLNVFNDRIAVERLTEVNAYFAKGIQLSQVSYLAVAINAGLRDYNANYSTLDGGDPTFKNDVKGTKPNVGFGILYYSNWYYLGLSAPELTITNLGNASVQDERNLRNHYCFSGALLAKINDDVKVKPATLFSYIDRGALTANFSTIFYMKETLGLGLNYRTDKKMAGIVTLNIHAFHIGYSYQFGTSSNLGSFNNATHEMSLGYRFGNSASNPKLL